jgi:predicted DNA-binding protein YlxM (UPF0122 family)
MLQLLGGSMAQGQHFKKLTDSDIDNIKVWAKEGFGLTEIANKLENKVSRQRIKQITEQFNINAFANKKIKRQKELNDKMFQKWGPKWNDQEWRKSAIYAAMREKFKNKKAHCYKHEFSINFGDLVFPTHCPILGIELDYFSQNGRQENSPSFDRIDPSKGYIKGNVAVISWRANRIKNDGTAEEHQKIASFMKTVS